MRDEDGETEIGIIVRRGIDMLEGLDPAGAQLIRGIQLLLVVALSALAAAQAGTLIGAPDGAPLQIIAPMVGSHAFLFTTPATRGAEIVSIAKLTGIALFVLAPAALVGWNDWGIGKLPATVAWIPVIALCFYMRRYGGAGMRYGTMMAVTFLLVVIFNPGRADTVWWLFATVVGGATAMLIGMLSWRARIAHAFYRERDRFVYAIGDELSRASASKAAPSDSRKVRAALARLAVCSDLADRALPERHQQIERTLAAALRMTMAAKVVIDDSSDLVRNFAPDSAPRRALTATIETLSSSAPSEKDITDRIEGLRSEREAVVAERGQSARERFEKTRLMTGVLRMLLSFRDLVAGPPDTGATAPGPPRSAPQGTDDGNAFGLRLALQAAVAASITTVIGILLNLDHAYWATLTVIIVINAKLGATVRRTVERSLGTAVGVMIALAAVWLTGGDRTVLIALTVIAAVPIMVFIERFYAIAAGLIGFCVVTGLHSIVDLSVAGSLSLVYDTAIGAAVGLAVAWLLIPIRSTDNLHTILDGLRNDCRETLRQASAGQINEAAAVGQLRKHTREIAAELTNIESERLFARGTEIGTRRLRAYLENLALYVALLTSALERLAGTTLPDPDRLLLNDLIDGLSALLDVPFDRPGTGIDVETLTDRWAGSTELDGSIRPREIIWLIDALVYGRKCFETIDAIRDLLIHGHPELRKRPA